MQDAPQDRDYLTCHRDQLTAHLIAEWEQQGYRVDPAVIGYSRPKAAVVHVDGDALAAADVAPPDEDPYRAEAAVVFSIQSPP